MSLSLQEMTVALNSDSWRESVGFSQDIESVNRVMFDESSTDETVMTALSNWLQKNQPCLFGRLAAKLGLISYCILRPDDLAKSDEYVAKKIQKCREKWLRQTYDGLKSGFIILLISPIIAMSKPDNMTRAIAMRLCSLYLRETVGSDNIHLEEVFLEKPGRQRTTWKWNAGVNYFSAQGDQRWWHDHRIPGGLAFSVNSVGHMVKSGIIAKSINDLNVLLGEEDAEGVSTKIDSLGKALEFAMRTIAMAADTVSGKATYLLADPSVEPIRREVRCPIELPAILSKKDFCEYEGYYHTDHTIPSVYFTDDVERPGNVQTSRLDFTYLFDRRLDNADFARMGEGIRVRNASQRKASEISVAAQKRIKAAAKRNKIAARSVYISKYPTLVRALRSPL